MNRMTTHSDYTQRLLRVAAHIERHLDEPLDLERLAAVSVWRV